MMQLVIRLDVVVVVVSTHREVVSLKLLGKGANFILRETKLLKPFPMQILQSQVKLHI